MIQGHGFRVKEFRVQGVGVGFGFEDLELRGWSLGFRV